MYTSGVGVSGRIDGESGHTGRNTIIGAVVLIILLLGAGVAYTYFLGPDGSQQKVQAPGKASGPVVRKPIAPAANAPESASVQSITSPIAAGANASLMVKTNATSKCSVVVTYGGQISTDSGLANKVADEYGLVSWSWTLGGTTAAGSWPIKVTCIYNGKSAVVETTQQVIKTSL